MYLKPLASIKPLAAATLLLALPLAAMATQNDGSAGSPLRVILVPADGGTEDGTRRDFQPVFSAIEQVTGLHFDIKVGQSYGSVVEAMCNGVADIAWFGPLSYLQARDQGCAELLALAVRDGGSVYYSGLFAHADSGIETLADFPGKRVALGDVNSTSSFAVPLAMMLEAEIDPVNDLGAINMAGSHANVLQALAEGLVDAGGASFDSYERAVNGGSIDPSRITVVAKSEPIPYPPLAIHPDVDGGVKATLRDVFNRIDQLPGITPEQIRGYGGGRVDGYTADVSEEVMTKAGEMFERVNDPLKQDIIRKSSVR
ncbi:MULTISPECIES: phosphate/phosphite/phosphonate ABC transporter substrate-binding protein [unclassified Halomonas]|uniref:phosphate/phosphite/phosphonate ABC transporter substrate-binding protein n=1 Tax=unclassified Halomonas TaxID=2609666 RepID=UPI000D71D4BF|nr:MULTISPECIES: phosphate/phosphite/phosphonate ABC transporter substrate-binding protein [unclassified Halomonas]PWV78793.1 phosphonate transport system substrate-binding protein [Halomonas sp. A11-A]QJQ97301.1 phosphate/phosphite/phosphonate ABC transporter substrate-binding protein [Halomonas sp. PGE1]